MKSIQIFFFYFIVAFFLYFPARQAGLTWDFIGWLVEYKKQGLPGLVHLFNDRGLHQFYQLVFFGLYKLLATHPTGWFIIFLTLHILNAVLSFTFFSRFFKKTGIINSNQIAFFGSLFFLVSPYQTEPVVWKATIHYLLTTACILSSLALSLNYAQSGKRKYLAGIYILFLFGLFSLEIAISLPFLLLLLILTKDKIFGKITVIDFLLRLVLPMIATIPIFFLLSKLILGRWVAHYGASAHLNFSDTLVIGNFNRYLLKYVVFMQFIDYPLRKKVYEFLSTPLAAHSFLIFYIFLIIFLKTYGQRYLKSQSKIFLILLGMSIAGMMTTVNLYFNYIINIENDRFGYLGSVFILMMFSFFVFQLNIFLRYLILIVFTFCSIKFLEININSWHESAIIIQHLTENFDRFKSNTIYLLNTPDNFHGANVFRNFGSQSPVAETIFVSNNVDTIKQVKDVLYYNMETISDSVNVIKVGQDSLKVSFAQWGNWWWQHGIGANNFENDDFDVHLVNGAYIIHFKKGILNSIILYQCGTEWRIFNGF